MKCFDPQTNIRALLPGARHDKQNLFSLHVTLNSLQKEVSIDGLHVLTLRKHNYFKIKEIAE